MQPGVVVGNVVRPVAEQPVVAVSAGHAVVAAATDELASILPIPDPVDAAAAVVEPIVQVMDAVRLRQETVAGKVERNELFPQISLGDAPK